MRVQCLSAEGDVGLEGKAGVWVPSRRQGGTAVLSRQGFVRGLPAPAIGVEDPTSCRA